MRTIRVAGKRYSDPDVLSLIERSGELLDPRSVIVTQAQVLLNLLHEFPGAPSNPFERLKILASFRGIKVMAMDVELQRKEPRDAALVPTASGLVVLYNPSRPASRILFTIAHEITHTFFPNSSSGARFRSICEPSSREANELERLCDYGAAELVMPTEEFQREVGVDYGLGHVQRLATRFGTSFEATAFRMASAHPGFAVAGLLKFRFTKDEARRLAAPKQRSLFKEKISPNTAPQKKYRRQSAHVSVACGDEYMVRWNKSFDLTSIVYKAPLREGVVRAQEALPNDREEIGLLEATVAPYQREDADSHSPDILFFWTSLQ